MSFQLQKHIDISLPPSLSSSFFLIFLLPSFFPFSLSLNHSWDSLVTHNLWIFYISNGNFSAIISLNIAFASFPLSPSPVSLQSNTCYAFSFYSSHFLYTLLYFLFLISLFCILYYFFLIYLLIHYSVSYSVQCAGKSIVLIFKFWFLIFFIYKRLVWSFFTLLCHSLHLPILYSYFQLCHLFLQIY